MAIFPDKTWVGWAAGILDGEGCISNGRRKLSPIKETYSVNVSVANTDLKMLHKLKEMFGGVISSHGGRKKKPHYLDAWRWVLQSKRAESFLRQVLPWLVTKREQAELAILSRQYLRTYRNDTERLEKQRSIFNELARLKKQQPSASIEQDMQQVIH